MQENRRPTTASLTFGQLCAELGPLLAEAIGAPGGAEPTVSGVAFHDPGQAGRDHRGQIVLAVGHASDQPTLAALVREAAGAGAVAVACRDGGGWDPAVSEAAAAGGVSLASIPAEVDWGELYELIRTAIAVDAFQPAPPTSPRWNGDDDLTAICEALATMTGGLVGIDDAQGRVVAFSSSEESDPMRTASILNHRVPESWRREISRAGITEQLLSSEDVIRISFEELEPRRAIAIRLGRTVLGSIWLIGDDESLTEDADEALRRAAPIAALQMMRQRIALDAERRQRDAAMAALLRDGNSSPWLLEQAGLAVEGPLSVIAVEVIARGTSSPAAVGPRLADMLAAHLRSYRVQAAATSLEESVAPAAAPRERVYAVAGPRPEEGESLRRIVASCIAQAHRSLGVELRAGLGQEVAGAPALPLSRRSAEDCLAAEPPAGAVVGFEDVYDRALTADVDAFVAAWRGGSSRAYRALVEHDEAHGTEYLRTLRCLLESFGSTSVAAQRLHLHVNTVRYRLRRITEIAAIDFSDGDARLALELNLRALGDQALSHEPRSSSRR